MIRSKLKNKMRSLQARPFPCGKSQFNGSWRKNMQACVPRACASVTQPKLLASGHVLLRMVASACLEWGLDVGAVAHKRTHMYIYIYIYMYICALSFRGPPPAPGSLNGLFLRQRTCFGSCGRRDSVPARARKPRTSIHRRFLCLEPLCSLEQRASSVHALLRRTTKRLPRRPPIGAEQSTGFKVLCSFGDR